MAKCDQNFPRYRLRQWLNTSTGGLEYSIQTQRELDGAWMHMMSNNEPLFYKTPQEASAKCDELRSVDAIKAEGEVK